MKTVAVFALSAVLALGLVSALKAADETTISGSVMCAKCTLKKADAKECQDVLVVKDAQGASTEYYIVKNAVFEKAGHQCSGEAPATVTGKVTEKDGRKWIEATKMDKKKS